MKIERDKRREKNKRIREKTREKERRAPVGAKKNAMDTFV